MHNFAYISIGRSLIHAIELFRLWEVQEDAEYQVQRVWDSWESPGSTMPVKDRDGLCAVRTLAGKGWLETTDGRRQKLPAESLVILPWKDLTGWGTDKRSWRFYWFEFFAESPDAFIISEPLHIPCSRSEQDEIIQVQRQLRSPFEPARQTASAQFLLLLYRWLECASTEARAHTPHAGIDRAIQWMNSSADQQLSVPEMARTAGLSTRAFAKAFEQATGETPKRYHLNLRLDTARTLLLSGRANVKEVAEQLNFSSPFYLSKLYSKRFGHPPSKAH